MATVIDPSRITWLFSLLFAITSLFKSSHFTQSLFSLLLSDWCQVGAPAACERRPLMRRGSAITVHHSKFRSPVWVLLSGTQTDGPYRRLHTVTTLLQRPDTERHRNRIMPNANRIGGDIMSFLLFWASSGRWHWKFIIAKQQYCIFARERGEVGSGPAHVKYG